MYPYIVSIRSTRLQPVRRRIAGLAAGLNGRGYRLTDPGRRFQAEVSRPECRRFRRKSGFLVPTSIEPFFDPLEDLDGLHEISIEFGLVPVFRVHRAHRPLECISI